MSMIIQPFRFSAGGGGGTFTTFDPDSRTHPSRDDLSVAPDITLSNGNLTATKNSQTRSAVVTGLHGKGTGKWRYQGRVDAFPAAEITFGAVGPLFDRNIYIGADIHGGGFVSDGRQGTNGGYGPNGLGGWAVGDIIDVYVDCDAKKMWFGKNGTISGNPTAGTGGLTLNAGFTKKFFPAVYLYGAGDAVTCNFGATAFTHNLHPTFLPWSAVAPDATLESFRAAMFYMYDYGWYAHATGEFMLRDTSGSATNLLTGATASAQASTDGTTAAMGVDGNPATAWIHSNGSMNQGGSFWIADMGSVATRDAAYIAIQARAGLSGEHRQAPRSVDLFLSNDMVNFDKAKLGLNFGVGIESWTAMSPAGQIKELALV